ncbi:MAG: glycosyltransferase [Solirubrobacteraceae bacterium]|nr:glycosyltransferase [Solirubrobacteraceae bacterium]
MALRLTDPASSTASSAAPAAPQAAPAIALRARAQRLLADGDVAGYRRLFAEAAAVEDIHRRYEARVRLLEAGMAATGTSPNVIAPVFLAVADAAVTMLEEEPREPVILNTAGVALYELGELTAAERLFKAAERLDPNLPHLDGNLKELARRRSAGLEGRVPLPATVSVQLKGLRDRAKRVAGRARPAEGMTLSLCMIVKDEEAMLGRCLDAIADWVDEIIVVDTGSTDRTVEIARARGARVLHHEWTGDFSAARNASFEAATGDWIIYLDADEVLVEGDGPRLRELTGRVWREAFFLTETNLTGRIEDGTSVTHNALRVIRNRPEYRFEGRIHEQIAHAMPGYLAERFESTSVRIDHYGYLGEVREAKDKSRRNLELLERQVADGVDTPFLHFNLGSEYQALDENERALEAFERAWEMVRDDPLKTSYGFLPSLCARLVKATRLCGRLDETLRRGDETLAFLPRFTDILFEQALAAQAKGDEEHAAQLLEQCLEWGDAPSVYTATRGCGTFLALAALGDLRRRQGRLEEARELLHRCLVEHPQFLASVDPLASTMLALGEDAETVVRTVHDAVGDVTPAVRFMLAIALYEAKQVEPAETELRAVLERQPGSSAARLALVETLLSQARWDEAAAEALRIPPEAFGGGAAARAAAFARLAAGDPEGAVEGIDRARRTDLPPAEIDVLEGWRERLLGRPGPAVLPPTAADPLFVMLEALLRVVDIDAFATLVPLAEVLGIPWRERRERLAQLYLRRGFLESAADEWIAVCQESQPDADALAGLSWVAVGRELHEDALLFAREALSLDPQHPGALGVLERVAA